ncbi:replicative DNA helicase [Roseateles sp.]|uniref:replicative DNA helicase n=1 Tax=Roseateles sp. TaxID=1971397 RepID=UPI003BA5ECC6
MADDTPKLMVPPHSVEAEQSLLGGVLIDNRAWQAVRGRVVAGDFYSRDHADVWQALDQLLTADRPADVVTVFQHLQRAGRADAVGGLPYLNQLAQCVPSAANSAAYAGIVQQCSQRRRLMRLGQDVVARAADGDVKTSVVDVLAWVQQQVGEIAQGQVDAVPRLMSELLPGWMDELQARADGKIDAIGTGLSGVNRALGGGMRRGELIVLGARPSMGKSALTLGWVRAVAGAGLPVLVCSLEDSANMLISRHVASAGRAPLEQVRLPQHAPDSLWAAVSDAVEVLGALPVWVDDRPGLSLAEVASKVAYVRAKSGDCAFVVVDYLQLMEDVGETRSNELANIVRGLKNLAKRMNCAVLLLSQLSREADKTNAPPRLDHLAESGAIEQAADIIGLLWRESRRNPKPDNLNKAQLEFAKNKNASTCTVQLYFDGKTQRFEDMAMEGGH